MKRVLVPLPSLGSDPSEVAIPTLMLMENNIEVVFATPDGNKAEVDPRMLTGQDLGLLKFSLAARKDAVNACMTLQAMDSFCQPIAYAELDCQSYDAIYLPGGHDKTVKPYLESETLQQLIVQFFQANKLVAAICHGVVLVARSIDQQTGKSVIYHYNTTALLNKQEKLAYQLTRGGLGIII